MNKTFFVPTVAECIKIFPKIDLNEWKYGIKYGQYQGCDIFISGISKTNIAFSAALIFQTFKIESACLIGIAGAYRGSGLNTGDLVSVSKDFFVDEGMLDGKKLSLTSEMGFPICENNCTEFQSISNITSVVANTVSWLSSSNILAEIYQKKTGAFIETMEGAAFGLIASKMGVEAFQLRAISNYCGNRDSQDWNIKLAFKALKQATFDLIRK